MNTKRITLATLTAFALLALMVGAAFADGTITIQSGVLSASDSDIDFGSVPFSFSETFAIPGTLAGPWSVTDSVGDGLGWHTTLMASDFTDGGSNSFAISTANQRFRVTLPGGSIACVQGDCLIDHVRTGVGGYNYLDPATPINLIDCVPNADPCPVGSWEFTPSFDLDIPGGLPSAAYVSTVTFDVIAGP